MLTDKEIRHVASLARIKINKKEEEKFKKELSSILDYVDKLNKVDTSNIEPLHQVTGLVNSFRSDEDRGEFKIDEELDKKLIGQVPYKENRFVKVKSVFKNER